MNKEIITTDGKKIYRVSRWIKIQHNYNVSKRNSLFYYATDECGYKEGQQNYNPENGLTLDYFRWNNRNWAIEQFMTLNNPFICAPICYEENSKLYNLSGVDSENYYNPIMIELDDYCENVRVYVEG